MALSRAVEERIKHDLLSLLPNFKKKNYSNSFLKNRNYSTSPPKRGIILVLPPNGNNCSSFFSQIRTIPVLPTKWKLFQFRNVEIVQGLSPNKMNFSILTIRSNRCCIFEILFRA